MDDLQRRCFPSIKCYALRKLRSELGWRDTVSLETGIDDVIRWAERFSDDLAKLPAKYQHKP